MSKVIILALAITFLGLLTAGCGGSGVPLSEVIDSSKTDSSSLTETHTLGKMTFQISPDWTDVSRDALGVRYNDVDSGSILGHWIKGSSAASGGDIVQQNYDNWVQKWNVDEKNLVEISGLGDKAFYFTVINNVANVTRGVCIISGNDVYNLYWSGDPMKIKNLKIFNSMLLNLKMQ